MCENKGRLTLRGVVVIPRTIQSQKAVHEAGHLVAAWYCTAVGRIEAASIHGAGSNVPGADGFVRYTCDDDANWCAAVIAMAGMAAEVIVFNRVNPTNSSDDLSVARNRLSLESRPRWALPDSTTPRLPFQDMFRGPLPGELLNDIQHAFHVACLILQHYRERFLKAVSILMTLETVRESDLHELLDNRQATRILNMSGARFLFYGETAVAPQNLPRWRRFVLSVVARVRMFFQARLP